MTTQRPGRVEHVYRFICTYIERNNVLPEITDIMIGCGMSRHLVELAIEHLQSTRQLHEGSLLPTTHFPDVPF